MRLRGVHPDLAHAGESIDALGGTLGRPLTLLSSTESTSDLAKQAAREGAPHGALWVAEEQTAGRGRRGHSWLCPAGEGLLFSVLLRIPCVPSRIPPVALVAGLAVRDAVARAAPGAQVVVKWPNDVLVEGRKLAGVLVEAVTIGSRVEGIVVGIGVNVHTRAFPEEIADRATSVALVAPSAPDRASLLAAILGGLDRDAHVVLARGLGLVRGRLEAADGLRGRRVKNDGGDEGVGEGIDDDGRLLVRRDDGVLTRWSAGEVHLLR